MLRLVIRILLALSGWVVLGLYLMYDYELYGEIMFEHLLAPHSFHQMIYHGAMLGLPFLTTYFAMVLHQREKLLEELKLSTQELRELSLTDELTGLLNRRGLTTLLGREKRRARRRRKTLTLFYIDLDDLKGINDRHGHSSGDRALKETASILKELFRDTDILARVGGDEFVVVPVDQTSEKDIIVSRIDNLFEERARALYIPFALSVSIGVAYCEPGEALSVEELLAEADSQMYLMKRAKQGDQNS